MTILRPLAASLQDKNSVEFDKKEGSNICLNLLLLY